MPRHKGQPLYLTPTRQDDHRPPGMLIEGCWQRKHNMATKHELIWGDYFLLETLIAARRTAPADLALQLHFILTSESMCHHDSEDRGWREHRLRRRLSFGRLPYGI